MIEISLICKWCVKAADGQWIPAETSFFLHPFTKKQQKKIPTKDLFRSYCRISFSHRSCFQLNLYVDLSESTFQAEVADRNFRSPFHEMAAVTAADCEPNRR